jgi:HlyD family secretion protein
MRKPAAIGIVALAVIAAVYVAARPRAGTDEWVEGSGVMEATEVDVSPLVGGQLGSVLVREGDAVTAGEVVAEIEGEELEAQAAQARGALEAAEWDMARARAALDGARGSRDNARTAYVKSTELKGRYEAARAQHDGAGAARDQARARLNLIRAGTRKEQLEQARAAAAAAQAGYDDAQRELMRLEKLLAEGAVAQQQVDRQRSAAEAARAALDGARARLAEAEAGARSEEEQQAEAALAQAEANLAAAARAVATAEELYQDRLELKQRADLAEAEYEAAQNAARAAEGRMASARGGLAVAEKKLRDATVRAPMDGVVTLKVREPGETVAAGQAVVRLADLDHMWLRVYVAETDLDRVKLGQEAEVRIDAAPGKVYRGEVTEIAQEPEFTPKNVQTREQRTKLVFGVKVEVENPGRELKPGMPADARILTGSR